MTNPIQTMREENEVAVALLRKTIPEIEDDDARGRAVMLRTHMYQHGRWATEEEIIAWVRGGQPLWIGPQ